jgi:hypothetical protein
VTELAKCDRQRRWFETPCSVGITPVPASSEANRNGEIGPSRRRSSPLIDSDWAQDGLPTAVCRGYTGH